MTTLESETQLGAKGNVVNVATTLFDFYTNLKTRSFVSNI
jgi:hypothetical protein